MVLEPKEVSKPKIALMEVVVHIIIDFRTKLQVVRSMYKSGIQKNVRKSSREEEIFTKNHDFGTQGGLQAKNVVNRSCQVSQN